MKTRETKPSPYGFEDLGKRLAENSYPGRGMVIGQTETTGKAVVAYFIMGRSENSRNRVFVLKEGNLYTEPFDPAKVVDPSLIIYAALRTVGKDLIVTNGDQTDTICDFLNKGGTFEEALRTMEFEPDHPNLTPRISGMVTFDQSDESGFRYKMSILKSEDPEGRRCSRHTFDYEPEAGLGHFLHTYACDGDPLPCFCGEPERVAIPDDINEFTEILWGNLNAVNKVALYVRYTDPQDGSIDDRLANRHVK